MGELNKMWLALGSVCLLLGCAGQQIQCRNAEGQITYQGRYDRETPAAYIVEPNAYTRDFWPKPACEKEQA
jgi:hypothetical protein